jgi:glutaminase
LAYTDANLWGVAVETVDGRTYSVGDCDVDFSLQSCSKPLIYSLAVEELGAEYVSNHMGYEPSGN